MLEETLNALGLGDNRYKQLNLALQGGGAHGAYTWGVLDRLLEDDAISFDTISGTSAGAVNAVALADGYRLDGAAGARAKLEDVWKAISKAGDFMSVPTNPADMMKWAVNGMMMPFDHNPLDYDPLRKILIDHIDFQALRKESDIGLYIAATQVSNGNAKIFTTEEISVETVLASTCLPFVSKSIVIDGEPYWDGGFSANPALRPVILNSNTDDTLLVQISPVDYQLPSHIGGMRTHLNHLTFSQSLRREIELIEEGRDVSKSGIAFGEKARRLGRHRFHLIDGSPITSKMNPGSEMTPNWEMLSELFEQGRLGAETFLITHRDEIGRQSSTDLKEHFSL
ncbi:patatin-like phospholipase family protein [Terasakiella sp. A23]|uniref:patatin-like phospholipase family protein n=1 Tax=Terasakiella sp. FCG-A23 TaxID=3080561 RepID=UPI0029551415|nr:patatin-like phospholipase family protein [Terasakiella sp. A23]MDV7340443.1 patatin-like phospholipase family protein [Terasakiella sp. A23]